MFMYLLQKCSANPLTILLSAVRILEFTTYTIKAKSYVLIIADLYEPFQVHINIIRQ